MSEKYGKSGEWRKRVFMSRTLKLGEEYVKVSVSEGFDSEDSGFIYQKLKGELSDILADIGGRTPQPHPTTPKPQPPPTSQDEPKATEKQMDYLKSLCEKHNRSIPWNISKKEATRLIGELKAK